LGLVEIGVGSYAGSDAMRRLMERKFGLNREDVGVEGEVDEFGSNILWAMNENGGVPKE
jgi:hypothetical protein